MLDIKSVVVVAAMPGDVISDYIDNAHKLYFDNHMKGCILSFNGWLYEISGAFDKKAAISSYCKHNF